MGLLPNLLEQAGSESAFTHCTREYSPNGRAEITYEEMRLLDGQPCWIRLHTGGLRKKVAFLLLPPGQVSLQQNLPWLRSTHSIYVIYQVFSCSWLRLELLPTAGEPQLLQLQQSLPVAFSCLKFSLQPKGVLGPQKPLTKDPLPRAAKWIRPNPSIMPTLAPSAPADTPKAADGPPSTPAPPTPPPQEGLEGRPNRFSYKGRNPFRRGPQMLSGIARGNDEVMGGTEWRGKGGMASISQASVEHPRLYIPGEGDGIRDPGEGQSEARPWYGGGVSRENQREGQGNQKDKGMSQAVTIPTLAENWLFGPRSPPPEAQGGDPGDPDRHSMSLPLLQGLSSEFDSDD
ncbi:uncharacterized protein C11orf42 homolog isoform X3 [Heterocephalus glaber]|nr:uncharacterized protein C11orf42 homolog isoform X3 [Heterocephalus glaber]XP_021098873.1 uncharacterized protein C11orf42 homolog isoform X3 [Heterocephalus glaber]XP_021098874.1 uncharacterized protein C11orf42 homolog isoform X3 [Heterocephalus glaber]